MTSIKQDGPLAERLRQCPLLAQSGHWERFHVTNYCLERVFDPDAFGPFDIRLGCPLPERPRNAAKAR